jgi:hypothetical protein
MGLRPTFGQGTLTPDDPFQQFDLSFLQPITGHIHEDGRFAAMLGDEQRLLFTLERLDDFRGFAFQVSNRDKSREHGKPLREGCKAPLTELWSLDDTSPPLYGWTVTCRRVLHPFSWRPKGRE